MKTLNSPENFYYDLQRSRFREHAFSEWRNYRNCLTDLIIRNCNQGKTLTVFGAGRCNDIDLSRLTKHFTHITLADINEESMLAALKQYGLENESNIDIITADFVGINDNDYIDYITAFVNEYEAVGANFVLNNRASDTLKALNRIYDNAGSHRLDFGFKHYDYSLALSLHSQLNDTANWIWSQLASFYGDIHANADNLLAKRINFETGHIISKFNDAFFAATKEKVLIGYELGIEGAVSGIEGAIQTYHDLARRERNHEIETVDQHQLSWPYDRNDGIVFSMLIKTLSVK